MRRALLLLVALTALLSAAAGEAPSWIEITGPPELVFPRDHGAHPETRTEWWYVTGIVADEDGSRFGFQITFFRQGFDSGAPAEGASALRARQIAAAHLAVAEIETGRFRHAERLRRSGGGLAGWSDTDLDVWLDDWSLRREPDGRIVIDARDRREGIGLALELRPAKPVVLQGDRGYSQKGADPGNASAYLSWTRIGVNGELEVDGSRRPIRGGAWFDHEWGTSQLGDDVVGWDWFSLRLDDGRDLMVYRLRRVDGSTDPYSSGTVIDADGIPSRLARDDVAIEPTRWWTSPATGGRYPTAWRLRVPGHGLDLNVLGVVPGAELDGSATTGVIYWEGPVEATGSTRGEGYVELTGYAGSLEGLF